MFFLWFLLVLPLGLLFSVYLSIYSQIPQRNKKRIPSPSAVRQISNLFALAFPMVVFPPGALPFRWSGLLASRPFPAQL